MKSRITSILCAALLIGCNHNDNNQNQFDSISTSEYCHVRNMYHSQFLSRILTSKGIHNTVREDGLICYSRDDLRMANELEKELDKYFYAVSGMFNNKCEEDLITNWALVNNLPFDVKIGVNPDTGGSMRGFYIYSYNQGDVYNNRRKLLLEAPETGACYAD